MFADIHTHSTASDGTLSPKQLIAHAKERGLRGLSITDHDTIAAYKDAIPEAHERGILLGAGIEFSCFFEGFDLHLLGYDFDLDSKEIATLCLQHKERRNHRNLLMLQKLREHGIEIAMDDLKVHGDTIGRPHIAFAMVEKGYVSSIKEAFNKYLGEGRHCYARGETVSVDETIETLHKAHGKAFIAHPHLLPSAFPLHLLIEKPFDGIECWYARKSSEPWTQLAKQKKWLMSGGSDFHGSVKPDISLGEQGVDETIFHTIFEHPL